ncbi:MAG: glutathione S-transferase family protein [Pseudomonadota bacterium]
MKLVIGNKNYSSWSLRPWLLMQVLDLPFEEVLIPLYQPGSRETLLTLTPSGKVPTLIDGELVIWDSLAIVEYLAEQYPGVAVWPADAEARATARCVAAEMHAGFAALRNHMPMNLRASHPGKGHTPEVLADIARITELWLDCRARFGSEGPFLFGPFSAADAFYAPVVTRFLSYGVSLPAVCREYVEAVRTLPAMQVWYAAGIAETDRIAASEPYG